MILSAVQSYSELTPFDERIVSAAILSRWIFDVEIIARLIQARRGKNLPQADRVIYEFPLMEWRDIAGSKLGYRDFVRAAWELSRIHNHYFRKI